MQLKQLAALSVLVLTMAGCGSLKPASVKGGECQVFERPQFTVLGRTSYDQNWIDGNTEAGVAACGWQRPAARPASLQQAKPTAQPTIKPKPTFRQRVKARVKAIVRREPDPIPLPTPAPVIAPPSPPAPVKPVDPVDELIDAPAPPATAVKPKRKSWWQR